MVRLILEFSDRLCRDGNVCGYSDYGFPVPDSMSQENILYRVGEILRGCPLRRDFVSPDGKEASDTSLDR